VARVAAGAAGFQIVARDGVGDAPAADVVFNVAKRHRVVIDVPAARELAAAVEAFVAGFGGHRGTLRLRKGRPSHAPVSLRTGPTRRKKKIAAP